MDWSSDWVVPLSVAIVAAAATLIAAYIGYLKERRDQRAQILHDLNIAEKLPEGSRAKEILIHYAGNRALLLPLESRIRHIAFNELLDFVLFLAILAIVFSFPTTDGGYWRPFLALAAVVIILAIRWGRYHSRVTKLTQQYLQEQNLSPDIVESIAAMELRSYRPWRIWNIFSRIKRSPNPSDAKD
nr:hypothetical protein [Mycolicibacterium komanii]